MFAQPEQEDPYATRHWKQPGDKPSGIDDWQSLTDQRPMEDTIRPADHRERRSDR